MVDIPTPELLLAGAVAALELAAAFIILWAAAGALAGYVRRKVQRPARPTEDVRQAFGSSLLLALDFTIGSDVLKVAAIPALQVAATIGLTVLVRVVLTFVLERELRTARSPPAPGG